MNIETKDVTSIKTIGGSGTPGVLRYIVVFVQGSDEPVILHMMEANNLYKQIVADRPEVIQAWRDRTGIKSF